MFYMSCYVICCVVCLFLLCCISKRVEIIDDAMCLGMNIWKFIILQKYYCQ